MSLRLIVGSKCTLAASHAASWWVTVSMPTGQTDRRTNGWTPDYYITLSNMDANRVISIIHRLTGWKWRNFFIPMYASCSNSRLDVGQGNVNILQHSQSDSRSGATTKFFLNILVQFYLNNVTNLHQLTSHSSTSCPTRWRSHREHRLLWRHFTLSVRLRCGCDVR